MNLTPIWSSSRGDTPDDDAGGGEVMSFPSRIQTSAAGIEAKGHPPWLNAGQANVFFSKPYIRALLDTEDTAFPETLVPDVDLSIP